MDELTPNLGLLKPDVDYANEIWRREKYNENFERLDNALGGFITRADIPNTKIKSNFFVSDGYYVPGDLGYGAIYTSIGATADGLGAIQDESGTWFNLFIQNSTVNMGWLGVKADGVTDNSSIFNDFRFNHIKTIGPPSAKVTVTIDIATPALIHWSRHGLRVNDAVRFSTTGALPTGIVAGTTYYVLAVGMTRDVFRISATNAFPRLFDAYPNGGFGPAVNTSGSQSGTHSAEILGYEWATIIIPPGPYGGTNNSLSGDARKVRVFSYGAQMSNSAFSGQPLGETYFGGHPDAFGKWAAIANFAQFPGALSQIVLNDPANDAQWFYPNQMVAIGALDIQNTFGTIQSFPPNPHYFEFARILDIDRGTGVVTIVGFLRHNYSPNYPQFWGGHPDLGVGNYRLAHFGRAIVVPMLSDWDVEMEWHGMHSTNQGSANGTAMRRAKIVDMIADADGVIPSQALEQVYENCQWNFYNRDSWGVAGGNADIEVDKMCTDIRFVNCTWNTLRIQSSSIDRIIVDRCRGTSVFGTPRNMVIRDSEFETFTMGVGIGASESLEVENCRILSISDQQQSFGWAPGSIVHNFSYSGNEITIPLSIAPNYWAVPGRTMFVRHLSDAIAQSNINILGPGFTILNVRVGGSSNSNVTVTAANPAVVSWTAHGLTAGTQVTFVTTGSLPAGMFIGTPYYVIAAGLGANSFEISETVGGAAVVTTTTGVGTHTAYANPTMNLYTTASGLPVADSTNAVVTITIANPAVVNWTAHGLTANTPVMFKTTGALPTGLDTTTLYYVLAAGLGANSFEVSTSPGGSPVVTSGSQSGTQTAVSNPLYFHRQSVPRIKFHNVTGCHQALDLSNTPDGMPPWSYSHLTLLGDLNQVARLSRCFGNLISLVINVKRAYTSGAAHRLITANGTNASMLTSNFSATIDVTAVGTRVITPTGTDGAAAGDTIAAYTGWLTGQAMECVYDAGIFGGAGTWPIVEITLQTDQGFAIMRPTNWAFFGNPTESYDNETQQLL